MQKLLEEADSFDTPVTPGGKVFKIRTRDVSYVNRLPRQGEDTTNFDWNTYERAGDSTETHYYDETGRCLLHVEHAHYDHMVGHKVVTALSKCGRYFKKHTTVYDPNDPTPYNAVGSFGKINRPGIDANHLARGKHAEAAVTPWRTDRLIPADTEFHTEADLDKSAVSLRDDGAITAITNRK